MRVAPLLSEAIRLAIAHRYHSRFRFFLDGHSNGKNIQTRMELIQIDKLVRTAGYAASLFLQPWKNVRFSTAAKKSAPFSKAAKKARVFPQLAKKLRGAQGTGTRVM